NSTGQWFPRELSDFSPQRTDSVFVIGSPPEARGVVFARAASCPTSASAWEFPQEILLRWVCHALINQLSEERLADICLALAGVFYPRRFLTTQVGAKRMPKDGAERRVTRQREIPG